MVELFSKTDHFAWMNVLKREVHPKTIHIFSFFFVKLIFHNPLGKLLSCFVVVVVVCVCVHVCTCVRACVCVCMRVCV